MNGEINMAYLVKLLRLLLEECIQCWINCLEAIRNAKIIIERVKKRTLLTRSKCLAWTFSALKEFLAVLTDLVNVDHTFTDRPHGLPVA